MTDENCIFNADDCSCEPTYSQSFFILLSLIPISVIFPIWIVAVGIYNPWVNKLNKQLKSDLEDEKISIPYEEKYDISEATNDNVETANYEANYVLETTPDGIVVMQYSTEEEGFLYWADKSVHFKYLDTVARKFVKDYKCSSLYIDKKAILKEKIDKLKDEITKNMETIEKEKNMTKEEREEKKKQEKKESDDDVFATLKKNKPKLKTKLEKDDFVVDKANKFIKRGKICDSILYPSKKVEKKKENPVSFSDWKNMFRFKSYNNTDEDYCIPTSADDSILEAGPCKED